MSRWAKLTRAARRGRGSSERDGGEAVGDGGEVVGEADEAVTGGADDAVDHEPAEPPTDGENAERPPTDVVAEDALLDELSLVFADDEPTSEPGTPDQPPTTEPDEPDQQAAREDPPVTAVPTETADDGSARDETTEDDPGRADPGAAAPERPVLIDPGLVPPQPVGEPDDHGTAAGHTIQIGDEDLPEIRYLDEELGSASAEDGPVVIDDDDTADAVVASDATGRPIDGRMRQRRIGVRRSAGRRRLQWLLIGAGVVIAAIAVLAVLASSLFSVNQITVVGNRYTDTDALKAVIVGLDGTPVLLVDTTAVEEELEAIPWVEDARVRTSFPNSASIEIREREAVAAMPGADGLTRVLDKEGRVLDLIEGQPIALVWISGPITLDIPAGHFASPGPTWAAALVPKFTPSIRPRVESMQVTPDGSDLRLYLRPLSPAPADGSDEEGDVSLGQPGLLEGPLIEVRFGSAIGDNEQIEKLVRLERVLEDIGTKRVSVIDVSTAEVTVL
jgi:cell division protein FtsQ